MDKVLDVENIKAPNPETSFFDDVNIICSETSRFVKEFYPYYAYDRETILKLDIEPDSLAVLNDLTFFRLAECSVDNIENLSDFFTDKMQKLFMTLYSINKPVCYGIVSHNGRSSIVLGVKSSGDVEITHKIIEGLLPGMNLINYKGCFKNAPNINNKYLGVMNGIPEIKLNEEKLKKNLETIIKGLNGENYTVLIMNKPVGNVDVQNLINTSIDIRDHCAAISKRNITRQFSESKSESETIGKSNTNSKTYTTGESNSKTKSMNVNLGFPGMFAGAQFGAAAGTMTVPILGTALGTLGGGLLGFIIGQQANTNRSKSKSQSESSSVAKSVTESYSEAISNSITHGGSVALDIQNGFAMELMQMAENTKDRLKIGSNVGMWETTISYSADTEIARDIIQGCLYSEIASANKEILPPYCISTTSQELLKLKDKNNIDPLQHLIIPKNFFESIGVSNNPLSSIINTEELSGICTIPIENIPYFQIKNSKSYPLIGEEVQQYDDIKLGNVCEYNRELDNLQFILSENDLNKHTFVCGITGSGKTNTIKHILQNCKKPFLVIEPAKKEYRNLEINGTRPIIYTLGKPELNCLRINPFYILPGISPQQHIDFLKDLFNASFSFYGPMPYIIEKCLHNIYIKKGWNLTLGYHPYLVNINSSDEFFDSDNIMEQYEKEAHRFLFPTMQDLKDEVDYYMKYEMEYDDEVQGNIRSAIKTRIDSLCVGAKGYMFNTHEMVNFDEILKSNCVMELEGLADDSDKAFTLGLLIIYITEYRQIFKEIDSNYDSKLQHLLVIEEAHRLLKNIQTERNNESFGNPKGKAVEHFTNIIAEMRSYGQGVIVAEQIPSKLAPDIIKNSSNKIIHRVVAHDDQEIIANMIGIKSEDSIYLGNNKTGYALCHKEGMNLPVYVKINKVGKGNISDEVLYKDNLKEKLVEINKSIINSNFHEMIEIYSVKILNTILLYDDTQFLYNNIENILKYMKKKTRSIAIPIANFDKTIFSLIQDEIILLITTGTYSKNYLIDNSFISNLDNIFNELDISDYQVLRGKLELYYNKRVKNVAEDIIVELILPSYIKDKDVVEIINSYLLIKDEEVYKSIIRKLEERRTSKYDSNYC